MSTVWSALAGLLGVRVFRDNRTGAVLGLLVFSHWVLDFISHPMARVTLRPFSVTPAAGPDLPILFDRSPKVGLGLYNSVGGVIAGVVIEVGLLALGIVSYLRRPRPTPSVPTPIERIGLGGVNSYLVKARDGFVLIDTGFSNSRAKLERRLAAAGCIPGNLKLILLTHGDQDHAGNAAYLRERYGAPIAMHRADAGMVERGDMAWNRKTRPDSFSLAFRIVGGIASLFTRPTAFDMFEPDLCVEDGYDLAPYGLDARVVAIPGHSKGSIGVLTADGDLFCGDLIYNMAKAGFPVYIDDLADYHASIARLQSLRIETVYPGHGTPFRMERFLKGRPVKLRVGK